MDIANKLFAGALCVGVGIFGGAWLGEIATKSNLKDGSAYSVDLNKDGINDILVKSSGEYTSLIYLGQKDGTFKNINQVKGELENTIEEIEENAKKIGIE